MVMVDREGLPAGRMDIAGTAGGIHALTTCVSAGDHVLLTGTHMSNDTPGIDILELRAKARRLKLEHGLDLIIVDYLQLMQGVGLFENRNQEISSISRSLKGLAKARDQARRLLTRIRDGRASGQDPEPSGGGPELAPSHFNAAARREESEPGRRW